MTQSGAPDANLGQLRAIEADIGAGRLRQAAAAIDGLARVAPSDARVYQAGAALARVSGNLPAPDGNTSEFSQCFGVPDLLFVNGFEMTCSGAD